MESLGGSWGAIIMNKKMKCIISFIIVFLIPSLVFAGGADSYGLISKVLQSILNAVSWFGYAIALRNVDIHRNKICIKWSK